MSLSLAAQMKLSIKSWFDNILDLSTISDDLSLTITDDLTNGTGADKAQVCWHDQRTLGTTTGEDIDLVGALTCAFGVVTFDNIKMIVIKVVTETSGYTLQVGGSAGGGPIDSIFVDTSDKIVIGAGGLLALSSPVNGYDLDPTTADDLYIYNPSGGDVVYDIWVVGEGSVA